MWITIFLGVTRTELSQVGPALVPEVKECFDVIGGERGRVRQRPARESLDVAFLGGKDVSYHVAHDSEAPIAVRTGADLERRYTVLREPGVPLLAFPVGVIEQIVETDHCGVR